MISCIINLDTSGKIYTIRILTSQRKPSSTDMGKTKALFDCQENGRKEGKMGEKKIELSLPYKQPDFNSFFHKCRRDRGPNDISSIHLLEM